MDVHNIIQIHNNIMWDRQYFVEYFPYSDWIWELFCKILSWIKIILYELFVVYNISLCFVIVHVSYVGML